MFAPALTVAPLANPVPVIVTLAAAPTNPCAGLMLVIVGATLPVPELTAGRCGQYGGRSLPSPPVGSVAVVAFVVPVPTETPVIEPVAIVKMEASEGYQVGKKSLIDCEIFVQLLVPMALTVVVASTLPYAE